MLRATRAVGRAGLVAAVAAVVAAGCASVVEAGPDATPGKGFQEVLLTAPTTEPTTSPTSSGTSGPVATATTTASSPSPATSTSSPSGGTAAPTTGGAPTATSPSGGLVFTVGECLTWDQSTTTVTFFVVDCDDEHLVEIAGQGDLSKAFGPDAAYPELTDLRQAVSDVCTPLVDTYLGGPPAEGVDPGVIPPTDASWEAGDRTAWCTVGLARVDDKRPSYTGRVADR